MSTVSAELLTARLNIHEANARINLLIHIFGGELGERHGYAVDGIDAVALYLSNRDGIPPERTLLYKTDILNLLLSKEMSGWKCSYTFDQLDDAEVSATYGSAWRLLQAEAALDYSTECFGDRLASEECLGDLTGEEALRLYLINKHHWHPADVSALSLKAIREVLAVEMKGWRMTKEQSAVLRNR